MLFVPVAAIAITAAARTTTFVSVLAAWINDGSLELALTDNRPSDPAAMLLIVVELFVKNDFKYGNAETAFISLA